MQFGRFPYHQGYPKEKDFEAVDRAIQVFDLDPLENRFIDTLSGGERQRARAAMSFCQETDYLLLDEPLNNLDIFYARELMSTFKSIADASDRTILIVLHDINHAAHYADRIIALKDGQILANGPTKDIITTPNLKAIFGYDIPVKLLDGKPVCLHF